MRESTRSRSSHKRSRGGCSVFDLPTINSWPFSSCPAKATSVRQQAAVVGFLNNLSDPSSRGWPSFCVCPFRCSSVTASAGLLRFPRLLVRSTNPPAKQPTAGLRPYAGPVPKSASACQVLQAANQQVWEYRQLHQHKPSVRIWGACWHCSVPQLDLGFCIGPFPAVIDVAAGWH